MSSPEMGGCRRRARRVLAMTVHSNSKDRRPFMHGYPDAALPILRLGDRVPVNCSLPTLLAVGVLLIEAVAVTVTLDTQTLRTGNVLVAFVADSGPILLRCGVAAAVMSLVLGTASSGRRQP